MHGKLPFPEGTATTEILVAGEKGGSQAKVLVYALGIGIVMDYLALALKTWSDTFTTAAVRLQGLHAEGQGRLRHEHLGGRAGPRASSSA